MKTQWMVITPDTAKRWVESNNTNNRNLARSKVDQYANDMRKGNWHASHQGIAFYEDGAIADGQHRLYACAESGTNLESFVTFGVARVAASGIDCHRARKMDDQIKIAGMSDWVGKDELAIAKLARRYGNTRTGVAMSSHEAVAFCDAHKAAITTARAAFPRKLKNITTAPVALAMACAVPIVGDELVRRFGGVLLSGVMDDKKDVAAIRLRERLLADGPTFMRSDTDRIALTRLVMRAIKAFAERQELSKLQIPDQFLFPMLLSPDAAAQAAKEAGK